MNPMPAEGALAITWTRWTPGPLSGISDTVHVSLTDFHYRTGEDLRAATALGLKLLRTWPVLHAAVGAWLWSAAAENRGGSLSVWRSADDLQRFIAWPVHAAIMSAWRDRGSVVSHAWTSPSVDPVSIRARAERHLNNGEDGGCG